MLALRGECDRIHLYMDQSKSLCPEQSVLRLLPIIQLRNILLSG
ncbi:MULTISPECIES: hypothetical protein [Cyanophyceae]|nr:hypothetical protein [Trichocoleus sp. FACHB-69]